MSDSTQPEVNHKKQRLGRGLGSLLGSNTNVDHLSAGLSGFAGGVSNQSGQSGNLSRGSGGEVDNQETSLFHKTNSLTFSEAKVWQIPIEKMIPSKYQPRESFESEKLGELAKSIKENGIIQPIVAKKLSNNSFEIIAGERRWRAAQVAGLHEVPVIIKNFDNKQTLEIAIIENIQRENLNPIEEAKAYQRLVSEFGLTQQQIADKVGKERTSIANSLRLNQLGEEVRQLLKDKIISMGHAKVLLSLPEAEEQLFCAKKIKKEGLSVRQLETLVEGLKKKKIKTENVMQNQKKGIEAKMIAALSDELQKSFGTKVTIDYFESRGKISIQFYSDDEFTNIIDRLKQGCQK